MTTKLRIPKFAPEICSNITIINFTMTESVLTQKFLSLIVSK